MSRASIKMLHTSDVHIGAFTQGVSRLADQDKCLLSFRAVVDIAIKEEVDIFLIAGDFFDHNRVDQRVTDFTFNQLQRLPMPTVILPGNHDPLTHDSAYWRMDLAQAPNVHLIQDEEGETFSFPDLDLAVWGRPHYSYDDDVLPLRNPPPRGPETWQIAIAHGHFVRTHEDLGRAYPILPEEIEVCGRDYVALGHADGHILLADSPMAYYSGSPTWTGLSALVEFHGDNGARRIEVQRIEVRP